MKGAFPVTLKTQLMNILCGVLCLALVVAQFLPFWHYGEQNELSASIQGYVWFPEDYKALGTHLADTVDPDHDVGSIITMPILTLICGALGFVLCLFKSRLPYVPLLPAVCGLAGTWGYLTKAVFRVGSGWGLHLALCIALLALGVAALVSAIRTACEK